MSKKVIASFTLFAFLSLGASPVLAAPSGEKAPSVAVEASVGKITMRDGGTIASDQLPLDEAVSLGEESHLTLVFDNGNRVRFSPQSEFRLTKSAKGQPEVYLLTGKALVAANTDIKVNAYQAEATASGGEFVFETGPSGAELQTLSGDARIASTTGESATLESLKDLPKLAQVTLASFQNLVALQSVSNDQPEVAFEDDIPDVQVNDAAPNQDMMGPGQNPSASSDEGEALLAQGEQNDDDEDKGGDIPPEEKGPNYMPWVLGGMGGIAAIIILASDNGDDNVPSPSLP